VLSLLPNLRTDVLAAVAEQSHTAAASMYQLAAMICNNQYMSPQR